jgi:hypothetical protein
MIQLEFFRIDPNNKYKKRIDNLKIKYGWCNSLLSIKYQDKEQYALMLQFIYIIKYINEYDLSNKDFKLTEHDLIFFCTVLFAYSNNSNHKELTSFLLKTSEKLDKIEFLRNSDIYACIYNYFVELSTKKSELEHLQINQDDDQTVIETLNNEIDILTNEFDTNFDIVDNFLILKINISRYEKKLDELNQLENPTEYDKNTKTTLTKSIKELTDQGDEELVLDKSFSMTKINYNEFYDFPLKIEYSYSIDSYGRNVLKKVDIQTGKITMYYADDIINDIDINHLFFTGNSKELYMKCINSNDYIGCRKKFFDKNTISKTSSLDKLWNNIDIQYKGIVALQILHGFGIYIIEDDNVFNIYERIDKSDLADEIDNSYSLIKTIFNNSNIEDNENINEIILKKIKKDFNNVDETKLEFLTKIIKLVLNKIIRYNGSKHSEQLKEENVKFLNSLIKKCKERRNHSAIDKQRLGKLISFTDKYADLQVDSKEKLTILNRFNQRINNGRAINSELQMLKTN